MHIFGGPFFSIFISYSSKVLHETMVAETDAIEFKATFVTDPNKNSCSKICKKLFAVDILYSELN